jgi:hypothetical protein
MQQPEVAAALVVGRAHDPHAAAVTSRLADWCVPTLVVDVASLAASHFVVDLCSTQVRGADADRAAVVRAGVRGWLRRVAPDGWQQGVVAGSREATVGAGWLALLGGIVRSDGIDWLATPDRAFAAESKLVQYRAARKLSIPVPATVVASDVADVVAMLGDRFVVKPLGPGHFFDDGTARAVFAIEVAAGDPVLQDLGGAPFIAQQSVRADRHLRVVTVRERAWVCALDASGLGVDWRRTRAAHEGFHRVDEPGVAEAAVRLADALEVGYSSQDWVEGDGLTWFLDLNPGGQWLFLPDPTGAEVAEAIAAWLAGRA